MKVVAIIGLLLIAAASAAQEPLLPGRLVDGHIVPAVLSQGILINIPQRLLFYFENGELVRYYPVAVGKPSWRTPTGIFEVDEKRENPAWHVPPSIQEEMRREGKEVITRVAPGPSNPLGKYWLGVGDTGCGIHGTNAPSSVSKYATHGCIRLFPEDIADLFPRVEVGTPVAIIYEPVLLARINGRFYLEVHRDRYRKAGDPVQSVHEQAGDFSAALDGTRIQEVIREKAGVAQEINLR